MSKRILSVIVLVLLFITVLTGALRVQASTAELTYGRVDNLIITASDLEDAASRFAQWKNSCGILSRVLDVEWINSTYSGVDEPEKIRNCIRDFHSNFQTKYVTIFGDTDKVPIRYAYVPDGVDNALVPTDLYYADLNHTWDDNRDGRYGDLGNDTVDGVPDVCVGRIPSSFNYTAEDVVTKIIQYQQGFRGSDDWTKRVVLAAGAYTENGSTSLSEYISHVVKDKYVTRLYDSVGNLTRDTLALELEEGCIFLNFAGHSGEGLNLESLLGLVPEAWILGPHPWNPLDYEKFTWQDALDRMNGKKLPVVVTMSCLSAKVDWRSIWGDLLQGECLGEYFVMNPHGGAIAYFGSTGVAWASMSEWAPYSLMGEVDRRIFEAFNNGYTRLGDMWGDALTNYLKQPDYHRLNYYFNGTKAKGYLNEKTVMEFILLGDPTLRIYNGPQTLKVPGNYPTIQSAMNDAYEGDLIEVAPGEYHENITVNKAVSVLGEDREKTILDSCGLYVMSQGATISNLTVRNSNHVCVSLVNSNFCNISRNTFDSSYMGVLLSNSSYNQVSGNSLTNCTYGIYLDYSSSFNVISENNISKNGYGIYLFDYCYGNLVSQNTILDNNWEGISLSYSQRNSISRNNITNNGGGIHLYFSSNYNTIIGNNLINDSTGFYLHYCFNNSITGNNVIGNNQGFFLWDSSSNNISGNNVTDNGWGIFLNSSSSNRFVGNNIRGNSYGGIALIFSQDNVVSGNNITGNGDDGIRLDHLSGNTISGNNITNNAYGIGLYSCSGNMIYHNNFIDNSQQVHNGWGWSKNAWDNGYPFGGNHWSDYTGIDARKGTYQNETGSDGIGDNPYIIDANNTDNYPFMEPHCAISDIAASNVRTAKVVVGRGVTMLVEATVQNQGDYEETFNVTLYANATAINKMQIALASGSTATITLKWSTTSFEYGNYIVNSYAWPVQGETNLANNNCTGEWVVVTVPGDIKGDFIVDIYDALLLAGAYNSKPSSPNWNANADINSDNTVDIYDAIILANNYGKTA